MHIIVGLDTGKTSAVVCLDFDRKLILATHKTFAGAEWLVDTINAVGIPSLIACDREPRYVARKIAAAFDARLFYPGKEVSIDEKRLIAKQFGIANPHERDACAAAVKAYNAYANKLKQAEHVARGLGANEIDRIMAMVIDRYSISEAIEGRAANRR